jgi:hypothetical protein
MRRSDTHRRALLVRRDILRDMLAPDAALPRLLAAPDAPCCSELPAPAPPAAGQTGQEDAAQEMQGKLVTG